MANKKIIIDRGITVGELAGELAVPPVKLIGELFKNGIVATINQRLDQETAQIIVDELGFDVQIELKAENFLNEDMHDEQLDGDDIRVRPPIVAVMGHVDHGKTTLLDAILKSKVADHEAGGITQHISAYQVARSNRQITLLDTPGHEAFAALRQHGAYLTDVVVVVVAADDGVKPQTIEAIKFAQTAKAHIVVAINKIDKPTANSGLVKGQLAEHGLLSDDSVWRGDIQMVEVSAKTGQGIDQLLDMILLVADMGVLQADYARPAEGLVIEAHTVKGRGSIANLLVSHGILATGQYIVAGSTYGKIKTLGDWSGALIKEASPATPVEVTGFKKLPDFGEHFYVVASEKQARQMSESGQSRIIDHSEMTSQDLLSLISRKTSSQDVPIVVKADVQGSLTSVMDSFKLLETDEIKLRIIKSGVGNITENDIQIASSSGAVIYGFNVVIPSAVERLAKRMKVTIVLKKVIYELIDDARILMTSYLAPEIIESTIGKLIVKGVFKTTKNEVICGGEVVEGKIIIGDISYVWRDEEKIAEVKIGSVKRQQQEAKEIFEGEMCGLQLVTQGKLNLQEGDIIELISKETKERSL